ncbi:hypothetical protein ACFFWB_26975 [Flavobacterium procerum]|uniref:hypothetical protein n=1 Tax=Flavobacterium procerum TaxID=1455569 RepID=UPI0035EFA555
MLTVFARTSKWWGIGKKLWLKPKNHAKSLGLSSIIMTVISVREEIVAWYERHGYRDTGET